MKLITITKRPRRRNGYRDYNARPRLYIDYKDESVLENLANRRSRPTTLYKAMLPEIIAKLDLPPETKVSWSQKAGCQCGCSPGFILKSAYGPWDAWATVEGEHIANTPAAQAIAQDRAAQILADPTLT